MTEQMVTAGAGRGSRRWALGAVGAAAAAALVAGAVVLGPWADNNVATSPSASDPGASGAGVFPTVLAASEIPWDEVGPGWFLLGVDTSHTPSPIDAGPTGTVLVGPDGRVFNGPPPPAFAAWIPYWAGTDVWFAVPGVQKYEEDSGVVVAIDAISGDEHRPWNSDILPHYVRATATGEFIAFGGCCLGWRADMAASDGLAVTEVASGSGEWGGGSLSPDGTAVVWSEVPIDEASSPLGFSEITSSTLDGDVSVVASVPGIAIPQGWLDQHTLLLEVRAVGADWQQNQPLVGLDLTTGRTSPWSPPAEGYDWIYPLAPGLLGWDLTDSRDWVVTDGDGSPKIDLTCRGDSCYAVASGDCLMWVEATSVGPASGAWWEYSTVDQRVTLIDLTTGVQKVIYDAPASAGYLTDVVAHAVRYD